MDLVAFHHAVHVIQAERRAEAERRHPARPGRAGRRPTRPTFLSRTAFGRLLRLPRRPAPAREAA